MSIAKNTQVGFNLKLSEVYTNPEHNTSVLGVGPKMLTFTSVMEQFRKVHKA